MSNIALPKITWVWSDPLPQMAQLIPGMLEKMHRAKNLGMEVTQFAVNDIPAGDTELMKLNFFLKADGAWRASLLDHYEAEKVLCAVMGRGKLAQIPLGDSGGGRWSKNSTFKEIHERMRRIQKGS